MRERRITAMHVATSPFVGWCVFLAPGRKRAMRRFRTKAEAVTAGRHYTARLGVQLVVHRWDGTVKRVGS